MTQPPMHFIDVANQLLSQVPASMQTGTVTGPQGKIGVMTIRSASTTMTVFLGATDLRAWSKHLDDLADELSASKVVPASVFDVATLSQEISRHRG